MDEIDDLDRSLAVVGDRAQDRSIGVVGLRPRERCVVEPVGAPVRADPEPQLAQMLRAVHMRPEEPLDLAAGRQRDEQGAVAEHRRGQERDPASGCVGRACRAELPLGRGCSERAHDRCTLEGTAAGIRILVDHPRARTRMSCRSSKGS